MYGYNAPGHTGYKREQEPYTTYGNTSPYAAGQYGIKPVVTTSTYIVEENTQVQEIRRPTNNGYYQPASNMDFHPQKLKEYVTKVGNHPLPSYTHQSHGYDEPNSYGSSARNNPGGSNYGYSDYNNYGENNNRNSNGGWSRDVAGHSPTSLGKAANHHHHNQEYGRGNGGFNSLTRPYATGEPQRTFLRKY